MIATGSLAMMIVSLGAVLLFGAGCTSGLNLLGDGDHDVTPPTDADARADADAEADADANADADVLAEVEDSCCGPDDPMVAACQDGLWCNGREQVNRRCECMPSDDPVDCDDGDPATADSCDETMDVCRHSDDGGDAGADADADVEADGDADADPDGDTDADVEDDGGAAEGDADADADDDADGDVEDDRPGIDGDADADSEADGDDGSSICSGGWFDPSSGRCWQNPPDGTERTWDAAVAYCSSLSLGGYGPGSWHLPTISELRSLIRGCPATETGGSCGVTDTCLDAACRDASCYGCSGGDGPGSAGAYWPPELHGVAQWYWSSSSYPGGASFAWYIYFGFGSLYGPGESLTFYVRCVRPGP